MLYQIILFYYIIRGWWQLEKEQDSSMMPWVNTWGYLGMHNHGSKLKSSRRKLGSNTSGLRPNRIVRLDIDEGR